MEEKFIEIIKESKILNKILSTLEDTILSKYDYYLAGGAIYKTIFNYYHGYDLNYGINDYDIIYFDDKNISYEAEDSVIRKIKSKFDTLALDINLDIKNEARAYIWLKENYKQNLPPYKDLEDALLSWGFSACAIGIRKENNKYIILAPYGIEDMMNMIIRKVGSYDISAKVTELKKNWPKIDISLVEK